MRRLYLDIGSTNIKSMISDGGKCEEVFRTPFPPPVLDENGRFEVDPQSILDAVLPVVGKAGCGEVFISTQMHGYLLADARGEPVTRYISWQDRRAEHSGVRIGISAESGTSMKANLPRAGVAVIASELPEVFARAAEFFTLGSYLAWALTGNNATHITDAAASGYYNVKRHTAENFPLQLPQALYEVRPTGTYRGSLVYAPMGDQQCAVKGAGGNEETLILNLGTAAQMCTVAKGFVSGEFESRPYFGGDTLCTVTGLSGGKRLHSLDGKESAVNELAEEYAAAARRLPPRKKLLITGGAFAYYRSLLKEALEKLAVPYTVNEGADALEGLKLISEEISNG